MQQDGVSSIVFGNSVSLKYPHRIWLYLFGWPRLFVSGLRLASDSIAVLENDTIVTTHDHILLLAYKIRRLFSLKVRPYKLKLVLHGFIYTPRSSPLLNRLRKYYFQHLLTNVAMVICHSKHEVPTISSLVDTNVTKVIPVHFGIGEGSAIKNWYEAFNAEQKDDETTPPYSIVSAGRSSRDYETLAKAVAAAPENIRCDIICDNIVTAPKGLESERVKIHRSIYGDAYGKMLIDADIVAVPLSEENISAGQMVLLHALAAAKPVIITHTPTSAEYVAESDLIKLVPQKDPRALVIAIKELCNQFPLSFEKRMHQRQLFEDHFSDNAHGNAVFAAYKKHLFKT